MLFFFFNDTATTEIYTLSLHDALPIFRRRPHRRLQGALLGVSGFGRSKGDRKSTRLNSSHDQISYAVFCLKKQKQAKHLYVAASIKNIKVVYKKSQIQK